jgi:phosphonate transport system substrate-binding protein
MTCNWFRIVGFILFIYAVNVSSNASTLAIGQDTLVLGSISTKPSKSFKQLIPLSYYLQAQLSDAGISSVKIKVAKNVEQMQAYINAGEVDVLSETMLTAVKLENIDIELLRWKKGVAQYRTLLITQKDSDIYAINDLVGKSIALEDSGSTSGYLIPMLEMTKFTDQIIEKDNIQQTNIPSKINYIFSSKAYSTTQDNLTIWTHRSIVDAVAISDLDWADKGKFPEHLKRDLRVFHRSDPIPRSLIFYRSSLDSNLKLALTEAFKNAHNDTKGKEALQIFAETKKVTLITTQERKNIDNAREGYNQRVRSVE